MANQKRGSRSRSRHAAAAAADRDTAAARDAVGVRCAAGVGGVGGVETPGAGGGAVAAVAAVAPVVGGAGGAGGVALCGAVVVGGAAVVRAACGGAVAGGAAVVRGAAVVGVLRGRRGSLRPGGPLRPGPLPPRCRTASPALVARFVDRSVARTPSLMLLAPFSVARPDTGR
ncbi:hypothetical protein GCM10022420_054840 [Streptomyces iranensis]